jgi:tetratricopeptide (TPR) repeat protein
MSEPSGVGDTLDAVQRRIIETFPSAIEAIYVMGSITREATEASDIDVAVVFGDSYYNENIDVILPRLTGLARELSGAHPRHPLALWASKVDHYKTFFPDVSYVRRNLPRDQDRLDAWSGLAKHTLIHYENRSCHLLHGQFNIGEHMPARLPASESLELFLLATRTLAEALAELAWSDTGQRRSGVNHLAKAGLRAAYAVAIREERVPLDSYAEILAWAKGRWPAHDATLATVYAMKTSPWDGAPDLASVMALMRHCEIRVANAPRLKIGGLTRARAGESFSFDPTDLVREEDPIEQYSRFAGFQTNYIHSLYFLLTSRAILDRLLRIDEADVAVLDFFFEELSTLASYAFFNPEGVRLVLGNRERDEFALVLDLPALKGVGTLLGRLAAAYDAPDGTRFDLPWLTRNTKRARVRVLLNQLSNIPDVGIATEDQLPTGDLIPTLEWQAAILAGVFSPRLISVFNQFALVFYQAGLLREAQRVLSLPLESLKMRTAAAEEIGLNNAGLTALNRELSKTRHYCAMTFQRLDDAPEARASYLEALALDPDNYSALDDLTRFLLTHDAPDAVVAELSRLLAAVISTDAESRRQVAGRFQEHAIALKQGGRLDEAEAWYRHAMKADPSYEKVAYNLGILLEQTDRADEAAASYRLAIQTNPQYPQPYVRLGVLMEAWGDVAGAERLLAGGAEQGASSEYLFTNLGNCQLRLEKFEAAYSSYRKALDVNDQHADAWNGLGAVLMAAGAQEAETYVQAAQCFERAVAADPSFRDAQMNYQQALQRLAGL